MDAQVLVVGAGPVGLTMAAELARYRVPVRIVDTAAQRTNLSKALVLWSRTLELLERPGVARSFVAAGHKVFAANIVAGAKRIGHISLAGIDSFYPYALMLPQSKTEELLETHLQSLGIKVEREVELVGFTDTGSAVTATLRSADGRQESMQSDWLIGCDGAHSAVRRGLGMTFEGDTLQSDWILADIHLSGQSLSVTELSVYWHEDGVLVIFPICPGRFRVVADFGRASGAEPGVPTLEAVQTVLDRRGPAGLTVSDPVWLSGFRINERKVKDYRAGHVFLAGDAAHIHSPAGGQGMNTGMQDAFNLAWKLALVCSGASATGRLLDSYSVERSAVGDQVLVDAGRLTAVAIMKNHAAQSIRNFVGAVLFGLAPLRRAMAETLAEVSIGYRHSPLNGPGVHSVGGSEPGARVAPVAGQTPIGAGEAPRFALFAEPDDAVIRLIQDHGDLLEPAARPALRNGGLCLVRPDGYTACVAKAEETGVLAAYLDALKSSASAV